MWRLLCKPRRSKKLKNNGENNCRGTMRLLQLEDGGGRFVGARDDEGRMRRLREVESVFALAQRAANEGENLTALINGALGDAVDEESFFSAQGENAALCPIDHPDPARLLLSGTGLTHSGSAQARDSMHAKPAAAPQTDSMRMFQMGVEGGKPESGAFWGAQPEWFYKGDGRNLAPPGGDIVCPAFAQDGGEEPEIAGVYLIDDNAQPRRIGFALANEFSDHIMEKENYLWLAHSKLRPCALGPELLLGSLPAAVEGVSAIHRRGEAVWQKPFFSGEDYMCHSIANLERHHFKYAQFCRPGDVHVHFFGTATLSFADKISPQDGDEFIIHCPLFGRPLINRLRFEQNPAQRDVQPL